MRLGLVQQLGTRFWWQEGEEEDLIKIKECARAEFQFQCGIRSCPYCYSFTMPTQSTGEVQIVGEPPAKEDIDVHEQQLRYWFALTSGLLAPEECRDLRADLLKTLKELNDKARIRRGDGQAYPPDFSEQDDFEVTCPHFPSLLRGITTPRAVQAEDDVKSELAGRSRVQFRVVHFGPEDFEE